MNRKSWPRQRLHLRAIVSTTMVLGWVLCALSGLLPYHFAASGSGSRSTVVLGVTKSVWMSLHLWSSIGMVVFTGIHVLLNRKGVTRAVKVVTGTDLRKRVNPAATAGTAHPRRKRGYAWVAVVVSVVALTVGGVVFAADRGAGASAADRGPGWGRNYEVTGDHAGDLLLEETGLIVEVEGATFDDLVLERRGRR